MITVDLHMQLKYLSVYYLYFRWGGRGFLARTEYTETPYCSTHVYITLDAYYRTLKALPQGTILEDNRMFK